jgi:hypothetical protein
MKSGFPLHMPSKNPGQLILVGVPGAELDLDSARLFRKIQPGGFILFGRNIQTPVQLRKLIDDLRDLSHVEPIITIDQEGGRVSRLKLIGSEPPNAQQLRDKGDLDLIRRHGDITGRVLRIFGFNLDLCPVLDISFDDEADNSLRGRCSLSASCLSVSVHSNTYACFKKKRPHSLRGRCSLSKSCCVHRFKHTHARAHTHTSSHFSSWCSFSTFRSFWLFLM